MADLGNLWFSLGLDDSKFEKQWNAAFAKYKQQAKIDVGVQIAPTDLTQLNNIQNKLNAFANKFNGNTKAKIDLEVTPNTLQALQALKSLGGTKGDWAAVKEAAKALREVSKAATQAAMDQQKLNNQVAKGQKQVNSNYKVQSVWIQNLTNLASNYFSIYAVKNFVTELANVTGEFEKQRVTLQAMVGEMEGLDIFNKMKELSVVSPFQFKDLASYAKQLAAFSVPYNELYDTTKRLADVSAGLGVDMSRIILAFGQIRSSGVLKGTELRQLTEAGVPILDKLAAKFTEIEGKAVSMGDVFSKISQKLVPFEMVKDVFIELTSEGGKFYNMQEIQAETLAGKISNLKDAYSIMLSEIGGQGEGFIKWSVEWLYKLINNWEKVGSAIMSVAAAYGVYQAAQIAAFGLDKLKLIGKFARMFVELNFNLKQTVASMKALGLASSAGVWGVLAGLIVGISVALYQGYKNANRFKNELNDIFTGQTSKIEQEKRAFEDLKNAIDNATQGSQKRREAISQFNNMFGSYMQNLLNETSTANELATAYNNVAEAIENKNKEEAKTKATSLVEDTYGSRINETISSLMSGLKERGLSSNEAKDVLALLREYYKEGGAQLSEIDKIIKDRIGEDAFKKANLGISNAFNSKLKTTLRQQVVAYENALKQALEEVDVRYTAGRYSTKAEEALNKRVERLYKERLDALKSFTNLSVQEYNKKLKDIESLKLQELAEGYGELGLPEIANEYIKQWEDLTKAVSGWRKEIQDINIQFKTPLTLNAKETESFIEYVERIREAYEKLKKDEAVYKKYDPEGLLPAVQSQIKAIEAIAKGRFSLDPKKDTKDAKEEEKKRVNALKDEYNWLLKVYEAYNQYRKQGLTDEESKKSVLADSPEMPELLKYAFEGDYDIAEWFRDEMGVLSREAAKNGSDIGQALALAIIQKLGGINYKEAIDVLKIKKDLDEELAKWGMEDFALKGEGVTLDISKILRDQFIADNEAAAKRDELLKQTAKLREQYGEDWYNSEVARINKLYNLEIGNNRKIAQDKINGLAKKSAEELMQSVGISPEFMSSLADKSIAQLKEAATKLRTLALGKIDVSDEVKKEAEKAKISIETLENAIRALLTGSEFEIKAEGSEKIKKNLQSALSASKELVSSLRALDKDNVALQGILDFAEMGLGMAESIAKGDYLAAAIQLVTGVINQIAAAKQYREEMEKAAESLTTSITASRRELKIAGEEFETIFGENLISALQADSEAISEISRELKTASSEVSKMKVVTKKGFFGIGVKQTTLKDLAPQLFKADGSVNYEYLDEFLEAYGDKLSDSQKTLLENLKNTYSQYENAMADTTEYLKGIFSDTASTIAERMMDSFAQTGDAATELGDLVSGVAKQMGQDLIESILLEQYLQPYMDRIKDLYNPNSNLYEADPTLRVQKAILAYQEGLSAIESGASEFNKIFQGIKDLGVDFSTGAENASQVLSGLTEDQQNLLVSYINAIRADVSMNKGMLTSIVNSVGTINNNIATAIIIWTQIEANTHRSADGVDRIIGFFESVMGPYDGGAGQAFQVNIA